jgi:hypothetical protein
VRLILQLHACKIYFYGWNLLLDFSPRGLDENARKRRKSFSRVRVDEASNETEEEEKVFTDNFSSRSRRHELLMIPINSSQVSAQNFCHRSEVFFSVLANGRRQARRGNCQRKLAIGIVIDYVEFEMLNLINC